MIKLSATIDDADSDQEGDPEHILDEWLGELENLSGGLDTVVSSSNHLKPLNSEITTPRIDSFRFSMANLEDTQDVDLDAILGELCALEMQCERDFNEARDSKRMSDIQKQTQHQSRTHSRSSSEGPRLLKTTTDPVDNDLILKTDRTDSPDNDSAFSDTVSMLSSESSASSGGSSGPKLQMLQLGLSAQDEAARIKAEKIRMAMEKIKEANIQKLFVKVFTLDESSKSLLVDEKMQCSYVTGLLADKNHVKMDPKWALVEHLPELYMERIYEDHELLVENLMLWCRGSKNKIYFVERPSKTQLFLQPEKYLLSSTDKKDNLDTDEHSRNLLLEDFFSATTRNIPQVEGSLYLKSDSKKGWKKYHFVLRGSGLYYFLKEKAKSPRDLVCLASFDINQVYYGLGWKKKYKAPTDYCFAIKHPRLQEPKSTKFIKYLCAEDQQSLDRWIVGIRIAKHGKQLMDNYRTLMDELAQEDIDKLAHARSCSVSSIAVPSNVTTPTQGYSSSDGYCTQSDAYSTPSEVSSGRYSRASSSSSSGCMSDGAGSSCENAFDCEFSTGTIKRKPSMKPSLPLTSTTKQLKEVGETRDETDCSGSTSPVAYTKNGTMISKNRRKSNSADICGSNTGGTLSRQPSYKTRGSLDSIGRRSGSSTPIRDKPPQFLENSDISPNSNYLRDILPSSMTDSCTSLPPPPPESENEILPDSPSYQQLPPPPPEGYNSNLSLDSLPPPPNPNDLPPMTGSELTGSQLSLMSLPPPPSENGDTNTIRRRKGNMTPTNVFSPDRTPTQGMSPDQTPTPSRITTPCFSPPPHSLGSNCSTPTQINSPINFSPTHINHRHTSTLPTSNFNSNNGLRSSLRQTSLPRQISMNSITSTNSSSNSSNSSTCCLLYAQNSPNTQRRVNFQEPTPTSPTKKLIKKISFNLPNEAPALLPKKPQPPKRSDSTKLSSPKKLQDPPNEFLKDLQRVMRKKWQVAQKCKDEPSTTPHEVLGFRDPPTLLSDYKETNVSNWVQEHYGSNNFYENLYRDNNSSDNNSVVEYATSPIHIKGKRPPPPPPPKRSETTHLTNPKTQ